MQTYLFSAMLLPLLASASPMEKRAGAPAIKPIPADCTVINPLPHAACGTANVDGYKPDRAFVKENLLYSAYFPSSSSKEQEAEQCMEQCYGYGNGECKSSFVGYRIPTPKGYEGTKGGELMTACLLFKEYMDPNTFLKVSNGNYQSVTASNIYCPAS